MTIVAEPEAPSEPTRSGLRAETLRQAVLDNLVCLQGRFPSIADPHDWYMALAFTVRDRMLERWASTVRTYAAQDVKVVCYLSAEFLIGPQLASNLLALGIEAPGPARGGMGEGRAQASHGHDAASRTCRSLRAEDRRALLSWLETSLDAAAAAKPNPGRTETLRRLNRTEYQNAIRDLLALDIDAAVAPAPR